MKLLVTGGAGYIGSVVAAQLIIAGHDVVVLDKKTRVEPRKENVTFYREQLLRRIDLTKKLKTGGYL